jgi:hypothetical protein
VSLIGFSAPLIYARGQASLCDASRDSGRPRDCRSCVSVGSRLLFVCAAAPAEWPQSLPRELARAFRTPISRPAEFRFCISKPFQPFLLQRLVARGTTEHCQSLRNVSTFVAVQARPNTLTIPSSVLPRYALMLLSKISAIYPEMVFHTYSLKRFANVSRARAISWSASLPSCR